MTTDQGEALPRADWIRLAVLAWMRDPMRTLAAQMADDTGVKERSCQYWLQVDGKDPPADIVARACELARANYIADGSIVSAIQLKSS